MFEIQTGPLDLMRIRISQNFAIHKPYFILIHSPNTKHKLFLPHYFRIIKLMCCENQCCVAGSGSVGSVCFWASWIRILIR
jgi:hypothetical protein